ncbi:MAG: tryptophan synthase subunit alpha [Candidatus Altiarchaeales archaeon HGW-Altiarchaeales-3]|nr:MAG: tryptophan synthase subunit alpha [Candidatus Altiarchaeales archaeon HGW-Altiarchaeales-3]
MNLQEKFNELKKAGELAFMPYIAAGDPDKKTTIKILNALIECGADIIELGMPFSDPIADGPTIQKASERALNAGMNTDIYFEICKKVNSTNTRVPVIAMTYYNIILHYGLEKFSKNCSESGIYGIIVPDLPVEESEPLLKACKKYNINLIFLIAQTTTDERIEKIIEHADGFLYLVSVLGVTGARSEIDAMANELVIRVKNKTNIPLCLGFGISKPSQVEEFKSNSELSGVIVGSAIVNIIEKNLSNPEMMLAELENFVRQMKTATRKRKEILA